LSDEAVYTEVRARALRDPEEYERPEPSFNHKRQHCYGDKS